MKPAPSFRCSLLIIFLLSFLSPFRQVSAVPARRHLPASAGAGELQDQPATSPPSPERPSSIVRTSCSGARYPSLCIRTLSSSPLPANSTPADLALAAVSASSASSRNAAAFLSRLLMNVTSPAAIWDCREQLSDSSDQLEKTARELRRLRPETFRWQMDNAQTWASAAMTNQDTCVQGLQGGGPPGASAEPPLRGGGGAADTREAVVKKVCGVSQLTSNALYLINRLASTKGRGRIQNP